MIVLVVLSAAVGMLAVVLVVGNVRTEGALLRSILPERRVVLARSTGLLPATAVRGVDQRGVPVSVSFEEGGIATVLAFVESTCVDCRPLWRGAPKAQRRHRREFRLVLVTRSHGNERPDVVARLAPDRVPVIMSSETWTAFGVRSAPTFVLVDGQHGFSTLGISRATWEHALDAARCARSSGAAR